MTRIYVLHDIENQLKKGDYSQTAVSQLRKIWDAIMPLNSVRFNCIFSGSKAKAETMFGWDNVEIKFKSGENGADELLLDRLLDIEFISSRFDEVYVGGGDGKYFSGVRALCEVGFPVKIVCRKGSLHRDYLSLGIDIIYLDDGWELVS
jgi:hypothetical protein